MKRFILPLLTLGLIACSGPKAIKVENGDEQQLNCQQLSYEIQLAQQAKKDAHEDDHFSFSHMFDYAYVYKLWVADSHATNRVKKLTEIFNQKNCASNPYGNNMINPGVTGQYQYPGQYSAPQMQYQMPYYPQPPVQ